MSLLEIRENVVTSQHEVTVESYLATLWGIRPGESRTVRAVPTRHDFGPELDAWLRLWGLGS